MAQLLEPTKSKPESSPWLNFSRFRDSSFLSNSSPVEYNQWWSSFNKSRVDQDGNVTPINFTSGQTYNPISTELQTGNPYYKEREREKEEKKEETKPEERTGGEGGGLSPSSNSIFGDRGFHYAWEDWGPLSKGLGMSTTGFKGALNNAKIGLTGLQMFGHPMDDPGWASVMAANGFTKADLSQYYSMPGQPMPANIGDAFKQHTSLNTEALTKGHALATDLATGYVSMETRTSKTPEFNGYNFDRASYMAELAKTPAGAAYAQHVTSNNNVNATKTMLGAMALQSGAIKGSVFSSSISMNLEPHIAYDVMSSLMNAGMSQQQVANNFAMKDRLDSMTPSQRLQYTSLLLESPSFAAEVAAKDTMYADALANARSGAGSMSGLSSANADIGGRTASTAAKEALGVTTSWGDAIKPGKVSFEEFATELDKARNGTTPNAPSPSTSGEGWGSSQAGPGGGKSDADVGPGASVGGPDNSEAEDGNQSAGPS